MRVRWLLLFGAIVCCAGISASFLQSTVASSPVDAVNDPDAANQGTSGLIVLSMIDFETLPDNTPVAGGTEITDQYESMGVLFGSMDCASGAAQITTIVDFVTTTGPPNLLAPCGPNPNNGSTMVLTFDPPTTDMSAWVVDDQFPVVVTAFDEGNNVVDQTQSDGSPVCCDQITVSHPGGIARVEMVGGFWAPDQPDGWGIDDLLFETGALPVGLSTWGAIKSLYGF